MTGRPTFYGRFAAVAAAHCLLVAGVLGSALLPGCAPTPAPLLIPLDLQVEIPPGYEEGEETSHEPPPPEPLPPEPLPPEPDTAALEPAPVMDAPPANKEKAPEVKKEKKEKDEAKKPAPKKDEQTAAAPKHKIEVDKTRRVKLAYGFRDSKRMPTKLLSKAEIQKYLDAGAKAGTHTTEIDDDTLYMEMVRKRMYSAWAQPTSINIDGLATKVDIELGLGGSIVGNSVVNSSGSKIMDDSALRAVQSVGRISELPPAFVSKHRHITVTFQLTDEVMR